MTEIIGLLPARAADEPAAREWFWCIVEASRDPDGNEDADAQLGRLSARSALS